MEDKYCKLRGRIIERYKTVRRFCAQEGYCYGNFIRKMCGKTEFSKADIFELSEKLEIPGDEMKLFFLP